MRIALAGNPNSGKTSLFNALTGSNQFVGNWPGVTVEKKEGKLKKHDDVIVTDLPGIYSLSPYTLEEVVARNYLVNERPEVILNIVDGVNLERNLYLTTQLVELGIPVVIAVNMIDLVKKEGDVINKEALSVQFGCPVVEISALKGLGIDEAVKLALKTAEESKKNIMHSFSGPVEHALAHIEEAVVHNMPEDMQRWYAIKIFERDKDVIDKLKISKETLSHVEKDIQDAERELDDSSEAIITNERYVFIAQVLKACYKKKNKGKLSVSDKIDRIVTNRWLGLPIFFAVMFLIYYVSMMTIGQFATDWVNDNLFGDGIIPAAVANALESINCAPWLESLIVDGIIAGVGAVLGFLPQMFVLFLCLALLEGCGYMARIAFVMDRVFRKFGLSGKSFIPILIGTGCGVPGIMASRTIENEHDRRMTVMVTTFIPCSAKIPIIAMIAGAVFNDSALVATSAYFIGLTAIIVSGIILKKTKMFAGDPAPFVMELPAYHMPTFGSVMRLTWERVYSFVKKAGTIILLSTIVVWFATYFGFTSEGFRMLEEEEIQLSILAKLGSVFSYIFAPLGFGTWQASVASLTGLVAKENIVGTIGIIYGTDGISQVFTSVAAYSFLVFNLLCAPCFAAMGAIKREMNSKKWTWFAIGYECGFAYLISLIIYQLGSMFSGYGSVFGFIIGLIALAALIYLLVRKSPYIKKAE